MADRIVMGYWDCPYCDAKGIQGIKRECPNCGRPRGEETKFYQKSKNHREIVENQEYVSEEQAKKKGKGADWLCSYCGSYNSATEDTCKGCGHVRDESDTDYFQNAKNLTPKDTVPKPNSPSEPTRRFKIRPALLCFGVLLLFCLVQFFLPKNQTIQISEKLWDYNINIEKYQSVEESDWSLPDGAELLKQRKEVHHYNQILDHYETKTRTYQERVQIGSHQEYTYSDNGDGTFTEHSHTVPDYGYETRTEQYQDPVYKNVPVYKTKYYYKIWKWKPFRDVSTSGKNNEPYFGTVTLGENERKGAESKSYSVRASTKKKRQTKTYQVSEELWNKLEVGEKVKVKIHSGRIEEIIQ